jgi:hypothetical protein
MAKSLEPNPYILPGTYDGIWGAYFVKIIFDNGNQSTEFEVDEGIRGVNCKCRVVVDELGWIYVR